MYHVLYVDDDPHLLDVARFFLERSGEMKLETAKLATEALRLPGLGSFDAIVADYEMPRMDGIAFLKKIRADYGDIPFILFTGKGREQIVIEAINNGTDFYLQKGGEPRSQFAELAHKVKNAIERRRAKAALYESERRYRNLYHHALVGLFETSLGQATIVACNKKYCDMFGFDSVEDAIGKDVRSLYADAREREKVSELLHEKGSLDDYEVRFINRKTGRPFFAQFSARINRKKDVAEGTILDVTERRRADAALAESEETFRSLVEESSEGILLLDETGTVIAWNPALAGIMGIARDTAVGKPWLGILERALVSVNPDPGQGARLMGEMQALLASGTCPLVSRRVETEICRPDGARRKILQTFFPVRTARGFRVGSIIRDVTPANPAQ
ncbi:MAG: PAS domain S-box protein [Methanomicrobiales archaeon]|nr:PAS domain S-box protein [Methanomicrobiales archaeon]